MEVSEDIQRSLGRMEEKLDTLLKYREEQQAEIDALDARVTKLEGWRLYVVGLCAGVFGAVSALASVTWKAVSLLATK